MRSTFRLYLNISDCDAIELKAQTLRDKLKKLNVPCSIRTGVTKKGKLLGKRRRKPTIPAGTHFIAVDVCKSKSAFWTKS